MEIETAVLDLRTQGEARPLNVSATPAFAGQWLMLRIGDFWSKYPDILLNINPSIKIVDLVYDRYDMAIRYGLVIGQTWIQNDYYMVISVSLHVLIFCRGARQIAWMTFKIYNGLSKVR